MSLPILWVGAHCLPGAVAGACFVVHQLAVQVSSQSFCRFVSVVVAWKCPTTCLLRVVQRAILYWFDLYSCKSLARGHYVIEMAAKPLVLKMFTEYTSGPNQRTSPRSARDTEGAAPRTLVVVTLKDAS